MGWGPGGRERAQHGPRIASRDNSGRIRSQAVPTRAAHRKSHSHGPRGVSGHLTCDARPVLARLAIRGPCKRDFLCAARAGATCESNLRCACGRDLRCAARAGATCDARPVRERLAMRGPCGSDLRCAARAGATCDARPVRERLATPKLPVSSGDSICTCMYPMFICVCMCMYVHVCL